MDEHLTRDLFRAIHKGWRNPGDLAAVAMAHLFELCPRCRKEFESWRVELGEGVVAPEGQDFDAVFDRLRAPAAANDGDTTALEARVDAERKQARSRAEQLLALPAEQRIDWIRNERDKHSGLVLAEVLIEECRRKTPGYPHEGKALALLARVVLQHAATSIFGVEIYALALARLANALRVIGDLPRADQVMADARYFLRSQGGGERLVVAELDGLESSLRREQDRTGESISLLLRALMTYQLEGNDPGAVAACLVKLTTSHRFRGDNARAIEIARKVARLPSLEHDVRLVRLNQMNLVAALLDDGRIDEAAEMIEQDRGLYEPCENILDLLRFAWIEASILWARGRARQAEWLLNEVMSGFDDQNLPYDHALASMKLANLYVSQRRYKDAATLIDAALPVFERFDMPKQIATARALRARACSVT